MSSRKILIVDDDSVIDELLAKKLTMEGYQVETALSSNVAFEKINELKPDLILMDIMLPGMDGPEIVEQLLSSDELSVIPILFISGIINGQSEGEVSKITVLGRQFKALAKPFTAQRLLKEVKSIIG